MWSFSTYVGSFSVFFLSLVSNLLMLTGPLFMLQVYDRVLASRSVPTLFALALLMIGLYAFYALIELVRSRMAIRFAGMVEEALSGKLFRASVRMRLSPSGAQQPDPVRDLDSIRQFVGGQGPLALLDLPWMPVYLAIVFVFHPMLGWIATSGGLIITVLLVINELLSRRPSQETTTAAGKRHLLTENARINAESVLAMGMLSNVSLRWDIAARALASTQQKEADRIALYSSVTKSFRFLLQSIVLAAGAYLVIQGQMTAGLMIAASIVTSRALAPVEQIVGQWRGFIAARQAFRRIRVVLAGSNTPVRETQLPAPTRGLTLTQVATGPERQKRPLVAGINFELRAGEGLGILGLSGAGKSSMARALVGLWPILQGEIRLDGSELAHYDPEVLGASIGYLPQTVDLFDGTVAENISRFDAHPTPEAIFAAAKAAQTHELITSLPNGYDTRIGERGAVLSAGQRQRIGLARALYKNPFLIVLDEPNSNLDGEGDSALSAALMAAKARGAIVIVVAHRPSAIVAADKLLFLQNGRQTAFGPKDEILRTLTQTPATVADIRPGARAANA
jgi:ATP-binding cassette, subfamily C, bacterial PrsD